MFLQNIKESFKKLYRIIKNESVKVVIVTAIITALLSTMGSYWVMQSQVDLVRFYSKIDKQHQLLEEFIKVSLEFELLREQAYWNKYSSVLNYKHNESIKKLSPYSNNNSVNNDKFIQYENDIQFRYNQKMSELKTLLIMIPIYFDSVKQEQLERCQNYFGEGFGFDFDYMEKVYDELFITAEDSDKFIDQLNQRMEEKYSYNFYNEALIIINQMKEEI